MMYVSRGFGGRDEPRRAASFFLAPVVAVLDLFGEALDSFTQRF